MSNRQIINRKKVAMLTVIALLFCFMFSLIVSANTEVKVPKMYVNDKVWFKHEIMPYEKIGQAYFIPVSMFEELPNTKVLYIRNSFTEYNISIEIVTPSAIKYISLITGINKIKNHRFEVTYIDVKIFNGEYYLPLKTITDKLDISYETMVDARTGEVLIRLLEGSQKLSFSELVARNTPTTTATTTRAPVTTAPPPVTTAPPPVTTAPPPVTTAPPPVITAPPPVTTAQPPVTTAQPPVTTAQPPVTTQAPKPIYNGPKMPFYITFEDISMNSQMVDKILKMLNEEGNIKATFFLSYNDIKKHPDVVVDIFLSGHTIGLKVDKSELSVNEDIFKRLEKSNNILYQLIKRKSQIITYSETTLGLSEDLLGDLWSAGYYIWDNTHAIDNTYTTARYNGLENMKKDIDTSSQFVLKSDFGKYADSNLKMVIEYIEASNRYFYQPLLMSIEPIILYR